MVRPLFVTALLLVTVPVMAQNPQPTDPTNPTVQLAPPNAPSPPPERIALPAKEDPSNRVARESGAITPPNGTPVLPQPGVNPSVPK
jgi:hypothetical protein